ncbi:hypothetical protein D0Z03_001606 [Geotrichum reessii]|nr:hypothetical protein D0Z03_001606 [Galactomyces reessii]
MNTADLVELMKKKIADKTISNVDEAAATVAAVRSDGNEEPQTLGAAVAAAASIAAGISEGDDSQASVALQIYDKFDDLMFDFEKEITGKLLNGSFDEFLQIYKKVLDRNLENEKHTSSSNNSSTDFNDRARQLDGRRNIQEVFDNDNDSYEDVEEEYNDDDDYDDDDSGDCDECCSNPDCENFTVEAVASLSVPIYSVLIGTNIEYPHHQNSNKIRRRAGNGKTGTNTTLIPPSMLTSPLRIFSYVRDNLQYGKSGDELNIFKTIREYYDPANRDKPAGADPPFFERLDKLVEEEDELRKFGDVNDLLKHEREQSRYNTEYSFPGDRNARSYSKSNSSSDSETCNPRTTFSLTPANYGDFVLTIPVLDFVKPIVRDGYVMLNGQAVLAQVFCTGTDFMPSFQSLFETLFTDIPGSWALTGGKSITPATFEYGDCDHVAGPASTPGFASKNTNNSGKTTNKINNNNNSNNNLLSNEEMAIALRGFVALELRQGILNKRVSRLQSMIAKGNKIVAEKDRVAAAALK